MRKLYVKSSLTNLKYTRNLKAFKVSANAHFPSFLSLQKFLLDLGQAAKFHNPTQMHLSTQVLSWLVGQQENPSLPFGGYSMAPWTLKVIKGFGFCQTETWESVMLPKKILAITSVRLQTDQAKLKERGISTSSVRYKCFCFCLSSTTGLYIDCSIMA